MMSTWRIQWQVENDKELDNDSEVDNDGDDEEDNDKDNKGGKAMSKKTTQEEKTKTTR